MLKIQTAEGKELLTLHDDGTEEFASQKIEEDYKKAQIEEKDGQ